MIVSCSEMQALEASAFERGVSAAKLMEEAGQGIASVVRQFFPKPGLLVLFLGKGNNAGDALVAGREILRAGWHVVARLSSEPGQMKPLPQDLWRDLEGKVVRCESVPASRGTVVMLDGLLGIGAAGPLKGVMLAMAAEMNELRRTRHAATVAMDIPSGLNGDTGEPYPGAVIADITVTVAHVKVGLLADAALDHVGRLAVVPLSELSVAKGPAEKELITPELLRPLLPRRSFGMHKGKAGRVAVVAGSKGFLGAGVLASLGALRGGAGLITLFAKPDAYDLMAMKAPPEVMVKSVNNYWDAIGDHDVIAIGPGLGFAHESEVMAILRDARQPVVVDADAITTLARQGIPVARGPRVLTPHPGEMARLVARLPLAKGLERCALAEAIAGAHSGMTLLLKGSRTVIATAGLTTRFNSSGHPAMATGGIGDVLTGLTAALIAQGMAVHDAAAMGSWLVGRSAEISLGLGLRSVESLAAGDIADLLGDAFDDIRDGVW